MALLEPTENYCILSILQQGVPVMRWQCTKKPLLCIQAQHFPLSADPTSFFLFGKHSEKWFLGHLMRAILILTFVISSKIFLFFFFSLNQFQLPETVVLLWLHHFMELSVEFLFSEVQQSLNNANLGFECFPIWACSLRCHRFHFLYNLLREGCLKFLSSLELVVASVFVGVVFFFVWLFTNHVMWRT